jgi:hypothetical protein
MHTKRRAKLYACCHPLMCVLCVCSRAIHYVCVCVCVRACRLCITRMAYVLLLLAVLVIRACMAMYVAHEDPSRYPSMVRHFWLKSKET